MKGRVTTIGLDIRPRAKQAKVTRYQVNGPLITDSFPPTSDFRLWTLDFFARAYFTYAINASSSKKVLNTSLRSAAHATDSTCAGCHAKRAATKALRQTAPVNCRNSPQSN